MTGRLITSVSQSKKTGIVWQEQLLGKLRGSQNYGMVNMRIFGLNVVISRDVPHRMSTAGGNDT